MDQLVVTNVSYNNIPEGWESVSSYWAEHDFYVVYKYADGKEIKLKAN